MNPSAVHSSADEQRHQQHAQLNLPGADHCEFGLVEGVAEAATQRTGAPGVRNAGKGPVPLDQQAHAASFATDADREHAEQIREWLDVQREIEAARREVSDEIADRWREHLGDALSQEMYDRFGGLAREFSIEQLDAAMAITARKHGRWTWKFDYRHARTISKYFHGILRNWREGVVY